MMIFGFGCILVFLASLGILRQKDVLSRQAVASIASVLGVLCLGFGLILMSPAAAGQAWKIVVCMVAMLMGSPLGGHILARGVLKEKDFQSETKFHLDQTQIEE